MKKILLVICSFCLILPFVFLGSFAYDPIREEIESSHISFRSLPPSPSGYPYHLVFKDTLTFPDSSFSNPLNFTCNGVTYDTLYIQTSSHRVHYTNYSVEPNIDTVVYLDGSWADDSYKTITILSYPQNPVTRSFLFTNEEGVTGSVTDGVTGSISYFGEVLDFIVSTQGILALLGLSVALFLIVPFSIRKFKQFVKGY